MDVLPLPVFLSVPLCGLSQRNAKRTKKKGKDDLLKKLSSPHTGSSPFTFVPSTRSRRVRNASEVVLPIGAILPVCICGSGG
mmetsp:Transcript_43006/g.111162  ORF Transcript_43006/g.111162 Transcript_43006/m.111162 type:complete len:82 (-) Transcript_43006:937-1182(-)